MKAKSSTDYKLMVAALYKSQAVLGDLVRDCNASEEEIEAYEEAQRALALMEEA